jgi:putative SOS response-associated peptidase YedK
MCGRYGRRADKQRIAEAMQAGYVNVFEEEIVPTYNVAPQTFQPVVRLNRDSGERELTVMRWGLVPWSSKDGKTGFSAINAKAETLTTSAAFREAFQRRRCLVPAEWFYEWQRIDPKTKRPFAIALKDNSMFAFVKLWERWKDKATGQRLETYAIVTTDPNELVEPIHNRMPVILAPRDYERWLAPADPAHLPFDLLRPYSADDMTAWKVSSAVGNVKNDEPGLIVPV